MKNKLNLPTENWVDEKTKECMCGLENNSCYNHSYSCPCHKPSVSDSEEKCVREQAWIRNNLWCKIHNFPKVDISCKECSDLIPKREKMIQELANSLAVNVKEISSKLTAESEEWIKEFDKEFTYKSNSIGGLYKIYESKSIDDIKQFISSLLSSHTEKIKKEIIEICEASERIELLKLRSCENDKLNWNYHQGKVHQLEDLKGSIINQIK